MGSRRLKATFARQRRHFQERRRFFAAQRGQIHGSLRIAHLLTRALTGKGSPGVEPGLPGPRPGVRSRHTPIPRWSERLESRQHQAVIGRLFCS